MLDGTDWSDFRLHCIYINSFQKLGLGLVEHARTGSVRRIASSTSHFEQEAVSFGKPKYQVRNLGCFLVRFSRWV
jgi:hypothetical protein